MSRSKPKGTNISEQYRGLRWNIINNIIWLQWEAENPNLAQMCKGEQFLADPWGTFPSLGTYWPEPMWAKSKPGCLSWAERTGSSGSQLLKGVWRLVTGWSTDTWFKAAASRKGIIWFLCQISTGTVTPNFSEASKNEVWWSEKFSHRNTFIPLPNEVAESLLSSIVFKKQVRHTSLSNRNWRNTNMALRQRRQIQQSSQLLPAVSCISAPNVCFGGLFVFNYYCYYFK